MAAERAAAATQVAAVRVAAEAKVDQAAAERVVAGQVPQAIPREVDAATPHLNSNALT